nr:hypothetical protein [Tanacetum cinerariifolium]
FWSTAMAKNINGEVQLHAKVDGKKIIVTESSIRRDLQLTDEEDEAVYKELRDSLVRVATTASSLEAEQDSGTDFRPLSMDIFLHDTVVSLPCHSYGGTVTMTYEAPVS